MTQPIQGDGQPSQVKQTESKDLPKLSALPAPAQRIIKVGAVVSGATLIVLASPILIPVALLGGTAMAVWGGLEGTKIVAEKLATNKNFQKAMGAISLSKLMNKVFHNSALASRQKAFKKRVNQDISEAKTTLQAWNPTGGVQKAIDKYLKTYRSMDESELKKFLNPKEFTEFEKLRTEIRNLLPEKRPPSKEGYETIPDGETFQDVPLNSDNDYDAFRIFISGQKLKAKGKPNLEVGVNKLAKLEMFMKMIELRQHAKNQINEINKLISKIPSNSGQNKITLNNDHYKKFIKPIEKYFIKEGFGNTDNFDPSKLSVEDCRKINQHYQKIYYELQLVATLPHD